MKKALKELLLGMCMVSISITLIGCNANHKKNDDLPTEISHSTETGTEQPQSGNNKTQPSNTPSDTSNASVDIPAASLIDASGMTLESRIHTPDGYTRTSEDAGNLADFLRNYAMKEDQSPVLLYDGSKKGNQNAHVAVFDLPIEPEDLQQCADSVIRVYAEYFWSTGQYDRIAFHFTSGFDAQYTKWADGYRIQVGDVFLKGGSPGHVVMIVDLCENANGKKAFLLAQGYMPAQQFHVLKNPAHEDDPWYYEDEVTYPFRTPEYTFDEGSLKTLNYLK